MHPEELTRILAEYGPKIRAFFIARAPCGEDVDDLCQECMLAIVNSYSRYAGRSSVSTWIYAICRNIYSHHAYHKKRDSALQETLKAVRSYSRREVDTELKIVLEHLSPLERQLYHLHYVEGFLIREMAQMMGRPEGTVKYLLHKLRETVRGLLG